tara:strand:+ start:283 stop:549 length:267 start_codon:yes stop_codon:yes gene_type:complete
MALKQARLVPCLKQCSACLKSKQQQFRCCLTRAVRLTAIRRDKMAIMKRKKNAWVAKGFAGVKRDFRNKIERNIKALRAFTTGNYLQT